MQLKSLLILGLSALLCTPAIADRKNKKQKKNSTEKVQPVSQLKGVDGKTFSYALGVVQGDGLKSFLFQQLGVDSAYIDEAVKGMNAEISKEEAKKLMAFAAGLRVAEMNRQSQPMYNKEITGKEDSTYFDLPQFQASLSQVILGQPTKISADSAKTIINNQIAYKQETFKLENQKWLADNKKKKDVITLPSGLQYRILTKGKGPVATDSTEVTVHYEGKLLNGVVFDSSFKRNTPANFRPDQVIKGWKEALTMMPEGSVWELYIPSELAYGEQGAGKDIPSNATLIFKIVLIKVKTADKK